MKPHNTALTLIQSCHSDRTGDAAAMFLARNCVAINWLLMNYLSILKHKTYHV